MNLQVGWFEKVQSLATKKTSGFRQCWTLEGLLSNNKALRLLVFLLLQTQCRSTMLIISKRSLSRIFICLLDRWRKVFGAQQVLSGLTQSLLNCTNWKIKYLLFNNDLLAWVRFIACLLPRRQRQTLSCCSRMPKAVLWLRDCSQTDDCRSSCHPQPPSPTYCHSDSVSSGSGGWAVTSKREQKEIELQNPP